MIQVQIASQVTAVGIDGVRWVLVDPSDGEAMPPPGLQPDMPPDLPAGTPPVPGPASARAPDDARRSSSGLTLTLLKLAVLVIGAALAIWLAQTLHGPVRWPAQTPQGDAVPARGQTPARPAPAPAASAAGPMVTAGLR